MPSARLLELLKTSGVPFSTVYHSETYSARELSVATQTPPKDVAKTVVVKIDGDLALLVLPASRDVDLELLEAELEADRVRFAGESQFRRRFPDCETGAMPPFGNLYGMKVYVDATLTQDTDVLFEAGSHQEAIQLTYADFERLVRPTIYRFSKPPAIRSGTREAPTHP